MPEFPHHTSQPWTPLPYSTTILCSETWVWVNVGERVTIFDPSILYPSHVSFYFSALCCIKYGYWVTIKSQLGLRAIQREPNFVKIFIIISKRQMRVCGRDTADWERLLYTFYLLLLHTHFTLSPPCPLPKYNETCSEKSRERERKLYGCTYIYITCRLPYHWQRPIYLIHTIRITDVPLIE